MADPSDHPAARRLLKRVEDLHVFPPAAGRVLRVAQSAVSTLGHMEEAVGSDPLLAGRLVALSNSAMYGRGQRVDDLRRAIQVLGFDTTRDTAIALALASIGERADGRWAHLWQHAMWTARVARALVPFVTAEVARSAYLCALLHDIGRQLMAVVDPEAFDAVLDAERAGHPDAEAVEREAFGIDHAALGAACLRLWSFPPELAAAVAHHHQPIALRRDGVEAARVAVLQLADTVAHAIEATDRVEGVLAYAAHDPARRVLGVRREQLEAIAGELLLERDELGRLAA